MANVCPARNNDEWIGLRLERDRAKYAAVVERARAIGEIKDAAVIYWLMAPEAEAEDQEVVWVVLVDIHGYCRGIYTVARGGRDHVDVDLVDILRAPLVGGARWFVIVHNHPSGSCWPSPEDGDLTRRVEKAAQVVELTMLDHVVIGLREYYSYLQKKAWKVSA